MIVGVYSAKGGVGKTTIAVNLAWASAALSSRSTLLWDLDAQGGASYILRQSPVGSELRKRILENDNLGSLIRRSEYDRLDVLPSDQSLRHLDRHFHDLGKSGRLAKVASNLSANYDRIIIDCPPGLTDTSEQILRASDLVVVPVIPSALSQRSLDAVSEYLQRKKAPQVVLAPVFSMVDRRRQLHLRELQSHSRWPIIPMASAYERVSTEQAPIGALLPRKSSPVEAIAQLWRRIEKALAAAH
ncbi:MAG TPA: ParA family protein [Sphingomicrobium sp.]|nr:ParA family protein [Sphingomicrobium sp.]